MQKLLGPLLATTTLLWAACAAADTPVLVRSVDPQAAYDAKRLFAGRIVAGRSAQLGFKSGGELARVHVDIGQQVTRGQPLAQLDVRDLQAALQAADANVALAKANLRALDAQARLSAQTEARFRQLHAEGHASKQQYDEQKLNLQAKSAEVGVAAAQLQAAEAEREMASVRLQQATLFAPFDGIVQIRSFDEGAQISPGVTVLRLLENQRLEAHIGLPEQLAGQLHANGQYAVQWGDVELEASLRSVLPELDPTTRTLTAVFDLPADNVPVGAVVELAFSQPVNEPGFWVPISALTERDRGLWGVYVVSTDNVVERRVVEMLHTEADRAYVRGTLTKADRVVVTGVQRIVPGQTVLPRQEEQMSSAAQHDAKG